MIGIKKPPEGGKGLQGIIQYLSGNIRFYRVNNRHKIPDPFLYSRVD